MGQPDVTNLASSHAEFIGVWRQTGGSETSQYPQEQKSIEIPLVVASERGKAQTICSNTDGVVGLLQGFTREVTKLWCSRRFLERTTEEGESPVGETLRSSWKQFPSTAGHVEPRGKLGRPFPKAKYLLATDSELVP